jgi:hypothetical protein
MSPKRRRKKMPHAKRRALAVMRRIGDKAHPCVGVEVGVLRGKMSAYMLRAHRRLQLYMVDSWKPMNEHPEAYRETGDKTAHHSPEEAEACMQAAQKNTYEWADRRCIIRLDSVDAARTFRDGTLDFVFIDADHSYPAVVADIEAWWPKVKPGGILSGHDYGKKKEELRGFGVLRAVDEFVEREGLELDLGRNSTWFVRRPS